jgi:hypothetical protein
MSKAIVEKLDIGIAQLYAESRLDHYIPEYYAPNLPAGKTSTDNPKDSEPAVI